MPLSIIDPISDPRWAELVQCHPQASVFHQPQWLAALKTTYGYQPLALTTTPEGRPLENGWPLCEVDSWLTGRRLVSLPFSDHCAPLVPDADVWHVMLSGAREEAERRGCRYLEARLPNMDHSMVPPDEGLRARTRFIWHRIDLRPEISALWKGCHNSCVRRRVKHADKAGLTYTEGRDVELLGWFYQMMTVTRRRHGVPPQPRAWFRNLLDGMNPEATIRMALKDGAPVAAILTLTSGKTLYYKYGCSDPRQTHLSGTVWLMWRALAEAREAGLEWFDLGRTDLDNPGLIQFKERLGAEGGAIVNWRRGRGGGGAEPSPVGANDGQGVISGLARKAVSWMPIRVLTAAGSVIYKHVG